MTGDPAGIGTVVATDLRATLRYAAHASFPSPARAPSRRLTVVLLAAFLSLETADRSTLSAVEAQLQHDLGIGPTGFGLLATVAPLVGLVATFPIGMLVDRIHRTRLLGVCAAIWAVAMAVGAVVGSFALLLVSRLFLGAVLAALPAVTSLVGDYFPVADRARMFGYVLAGELTGTAIGYVGVGPLGIATSWRWAFGLLAVLGGLLAVLVWRLREPARGLQSRHQAGFEPARGAEPGGDTELQGQVREQEVPAPAAIVPDRDPAQMSVREVVRYVLRVRSNVVLIVASGLSYLFLAGVQTYVYAFATRHLGLSSAASTLGLVAVGVGAVVGVLTTGRIADALIRRGRLNARPVMAAVALGAAALCFVPGVLLPVVAVALPLLVIGAVALGGANPPLDAARLDVIHHNAWGRAEGVRSAVRLAGYTAGPLITGSLSVAVGLGPAFALLCVALVAAGGVMVLAVRYYPYDVSAAAATAEKVDGQ